jgi:hypothetical protein
VSTFALIHGGAGTSWFQLAQLALPWAARLLGLPEQN